MLARRTRGCDDRPDGHGRGHAQARDRAARQLGERGARARPEGRVFQEARPRPRAAVHPGRRRDAASSHLGQRGPRHRCGDRRGARRLRQGCARSRHRQLDDRRRRSLLVRPRNVADQDHQGRGRKDYRLLNHGIVDEPRGPGLHPRIRRPGQAGRDGKPGIDLHADDVRPGGHRLVVAAVRRRGVAAGPHPDRRPRKRRTRFSQSDRPVDDRQYGHRRAAPRRHRPLSAGVS